MASEVPESGGWLVSAFLLILSLHVKSSLHCGVLWYHSHLYSRRFLDRIRLEKNTVLKKKSQCNGIHENKTTKQNTSLYLTYPWLSYFFWNANITLVSFVSVLLEGNFIFPPLPDTPGSPLDLGNSLLMLHRNQLASAGTSYSLTSFWSMCYNAKGWAADSPDQIGSHLRGHSLLLSFIPFCLNSHCPQEIKAFPRKCDLSLK